MLEGKRVLFIGPIFRGYTRQISETIKGYGAEVVSLIYSDTIQIYTNCNWSVSNRCCEKSELSEVDLGRDFDYLFVLKGEFIERMFLEKFKIENPKAKLIYYIWDALYHYPNVEKQLDLYDKCYSFDSADCVTIRSFTLNHLPLFYSSIFEIRSPNNELMYDFATVGAAHPRRLRLIKQIERLFPKSNKYYFLQYVGNTFGLFLLMLKYNCFVKFSYIYTKEVLSLNEVVENLSASKCILDTQAFEQTGLTMRTIESIALGKKLITTNDKVKEYDFYRPSNILVVDEFHAKGVSEFMDTPFEPYSAEILYKYSLKGWIEQIFS